MDMQIILVQHVLCENKAAKLKDAREIKQSCRRKRIDIYTIIVLLHLIVDGCRHAITSVRRRSKAFKSETATNST
jgi:hypothetical protein